MNITKLFFREASFVDFKFVMEIEKQVFSGEIRILYFILNIGFPKHNEETFLVQKVINFSFIHGYDD